MHSLYIPKWFASLGVFLIAAVCGIAAAQGPSAPDPAGVDGPVASGDARVEKLLSEMTLAEKIALIHGEKDPPEESQGSHSLVAFDRVHLKAGESEVLTLHVPGRALEYWSTEAARWVRIEGPRKLHVGASSRDFRLEAVASPGA